MLFLCKKGTNLHFWETQFSFFIREPVVVFGLATGQADPQIFEDGDDELEITRVHFYFKLIKRLRGDLCDADTYGQKIGINQSFAQRKVLSFDKICFCVPTQKVNVKKKARKVCRVGKNAVPLQTLS